MFLHNHPPQQFFLLKAEVEDILFSQLLSAKVSILLHILLSKIKDDGLPLNFLEQCTVSFGILLVVEIIKLILNPWLLLLLELK
ncbi:hypothetical protein D3C80_1757080 [compost metagenome]